QSVNTSASLFKKTSGAKFASDSLDDFFFTQGGQTRLAGYQFADAFSTYDPLVQRFVVADIYANALTPPGGTGNEILLAMSNSNDPTTFTAADWNFFTLDTSEPGVTFQDYPGNIGYNADALVITLNSFNGNNALHVLVNSISISALKSGTPLAVGTNAFETDYGGFSLRPTTMQDALPGGPMWFVQEGGDYKS
ncbi:MAG TPA: hypothetical protein PK867_20715, partial [Pirellulales bacterium]|nr:hypothetical protein [Pirellulales bacterium]